MRLTLTNDEAYDLVMSVAGGQLTDIAQVALILERGTAAR